MSTSRLLLWYVVISIVRDFNAELEADSAPSSLTWQAGISLLNKVALNKQAYVNVLEFKW